MKTPRHLRTTQQSGAALVEFALMVTFILFPLLAGTYEYGRSLAYYDALSKATRDAARLMSVADKATINSTSVGKAKDLVVAASAAKVPSFSSSNVVVTCLDASYNDGACLDGTAPGGVRVEITGYKIGIGAGVPFVGQSVRDIYLTPRTSMRYML